MKKIILFTALVALCNLSAFAQVDQTVVKVYEVPEYTKDKIYSGARIWIAQHFKSAKAVLEYENKNEGTLRGNSSIKYPWSGFACLLQENWTVEFTMRVDAKDKKFRLTFSNITLGWSAYRNGGVLQPAFRSPVTTQDKLDSIKPQLLSFGDEIAKTLQSDKTNEDF